MIKKILNLRNLLIIFLFIVCFLLALTKTYDFDTWIHLTMGRLIWTLKEFPKKEPFLYTILDKPFEYGSWLFSVIYYLAYKFFDTYCVILFKASTLTLAFYILLKDLLIEVRKFGSEEERQDKELLPPTLIAVTVLSITAILTRQRFVERPDTFLMVFLPFSIYSLTACIHQGRKYIYSLPFIHLLWANRHSSINLMFVPLGAFIVGEMIEWFRGSRGKLKTILIILCSGLFMKKQAQSLMWRG